MNKVQEYINYTVENQYNATIEPYKSKRIQIKSSSDAYIHCKDMGKLNKEHLRALYLNVKNEIIADEIISIGTVDQSIAHPRDIFYPAIKSNSVGFILAHNHPSGDYTPSKADYELTQRIEKAGEILSIKLVDHIIVVDGNYKSIIY